MRFAMGFGFAKSCIHFCIFRLPFQLTPLKRQTLMQFACFLDTLNKSWQN